MSDAKRSAVNVVCYAGHRAEETPLRFYLGERCIEVLARISHQMDEPSLDL